MCINLIKGKCNFIREYVTTYLNNNHQLDIFMIKQNWIYYTAIVGALPIIIRALTAMFMSDASWEHGFSAIDFVFFGLTLNLSNINAMIRVKETDEESTKYKMTQHFWSILGLIFLSINLGCLYVSENTDVKIFNQLVLNLTSVLLCLLSFGFSYKLIVQLNSNRNG